MYIRQESVQIIYSQYSSNSMNKEVITMQPEQLQFGEETKQLIKVTNHTNDTLDNCFFCMFNTAKYQFSPQSFSLEPQEQKLITITLKLSIGQSYSKQFAYLKTKNINKRLIIHNNPSNYSQEKLRSPQSGVQDLHTLSSRDYRQTQKTAYEKVIAEKEAYIKRLERKIQQQQDSVKKIKGYGTGQKSKNYYINQIEELQIKIDLINQEKQQLMRQNILIQQKFSQFKAIHNNDQLSDKIVEKQELIEKQIDQIHFLQAQCQEFLKKISEKQTRIRQMEENNNRFISQLTRDNDERLKALERKIQEQRQYADSCSRAYEQKIKGLESSANESETFRKRMSQFQKQIQKKTFELEKAEKKLESQEKRRNSYEEEKKKMIKLELEKNSLEERNQQLHSRVKQMEKSMQQMKEQTIIYKSKIIDQDTSSEKMGHYMEVALESCRNQNQILKKHRVELENSVKELTKSRMIYEGKVQQMSNQIKRLTNEIDELNAQKEEFQNRNKISKQQSHQTIMKLKSENIDLIQKLNLGPRKDELEESKFKLHRIEQELEESRKNQRQYERKLKQSEQFKQKLQKKVEKYKKQARRELKNIQDNVLDQLKKVRGEKKKLNKKVQELEKSSQSQTFDQTRNKTKTHYDTPNVGIQNNIKTRCPLSHQGQRKIGIKDQRKQLEDSQANSRLGIDYEGLYSQLGELRQFKNYVNKQLGKFSKHLGLREIQNQQQNRNSIFQAINFFKDLESKIDQINSDKGVKEAEKEIQFLKGRLAQLEMFKKERRGSGQQMSSIDVVRPQQDKTLLQYVRQQMKNQYKKLYDALKLNEDKYEMLKKKIYEEYRARLIDLLSKKDRDERTINKIQATLQRFIEGLANLSHKEAVLAKEVKLKQAARKQAGILKDKVNNLNMLLESKKGACSRQQVKVFKCQNQNQWYDNIRLEAQLLTYQAQNARLLQEVALARQQNRSIEEQFRCCMSDLQQKEDDICNLKKQVIKLDAQKQNLVQKHRNQIQALQKKFAGFQKVQAEVEGLAHREKEYHSLKEDLQRKKQLIKSLKEKEKMLEQLLESTNRANSQNRQKQKRQYMQDVRMQESLRQFKEGNRELRAENNKLKEIIQNLEQELQKKNAALKRMKSEGEQHRIKAAKGEIDETEKLRSQIRDLKDDLRRGKEDLQKMKKKKDKQIQELESEIKRVRNEVLIEKRSLQSIIRALIDTIRRIYCSLDILVRKKGLKCRQCPNFEELLNNPGQIDSLKVYESFESVIQSLKQSTL